MIERKIDFVHDINNKFTLIIKLTNYFAVAGLSANEQQLESHVAN